MVKDLPRRVAQVQANKEVQESCQKYCEKQAGLLQDRRIRYDDLRHEFVVADVSGKAALVDKLSTTTTELTAAAKRLNDGSVALVKARGAVAQSENLLKQGVALESASNPQVKKAANAVRDAQQAVDAAAQQEQVTEAALAAARLEADDARRAEKVTATLPKAKAAADQLGKLLRDRALQAKDGDKPVSIWNEGGAAAIQSKLGPDRFAALQQQANALSESYDELRRNGADLDQLKALYKDVPENWQPPQFRKDEQNWLLVADAMMEENFRDQGKKQSDKLKTALTGLTSAGIVMNSAASIAYGLTTETGQAVAKVFGVANLDEGKVEAVSHFLALAGTLSKTTAAAGKTGDAALKKAEAIDPVEQMILEQELIDAVGNLAIAGLNLTGAALQALWQEVPALGIVANAAQAAKSLADLAQRLKANKADQELAEEALRQDHPAADALSQLTARGKELSRRAAADSAAAIFATAAGVANLTGAGAPVGIALEGVAKVTKAGRLFGTVVVDRNAADKAKEILRKAQAGDGEARKELFKYHPRYAKGLLSLMALDGDPVALRCLAAHGLDEAAVARSSFAVIKRYLLKQFKEEDEPKGWSDLAKKVQGYLAKAGAGVDTAKTALDSLAVLVANIRGDESPAACLRQINLLKAKQAESAPLLSQLESIGLIRNQLNDLAASADPSRPEDAKRLAELQTAFGKQQQQVTAMHAVLQKNNAELKTVLDKVQAGLARNAKDTDRQNCLTALMDCFNKNLTVLDFVVRAL
jgi:hypothetical protein